MQGGLKFIISGIVKKIIVSAIDKSRLSGYTLRTTVSYNLARKQGVRLDLEACPEGTAELRVSTLGTGTIIPNRPERATDLELTEA